MVADSRRDGSTKPARITEPWWEEERGRSQDTDTLETRFTPILLEPVIKCSFGPREVELH